MFILFKKILNDNPTQLGDILVRADSIFLYDTVVLKNQKTGTSYTGTSIEISSFPNHTFNTPSTIDQVSSVLNVIDITGGAGVGSSCAGNPGVLDIIYPATSYPLLKTNMIVNNSATQLHPYVFNPEYLVFSENIVYQDSKTSAQNTALLIVLRDSQPRRIITALELDVLVAVLEPVIVPV